MRWIFHKEVGTFPEEFKAYLFIYYNRNNKEYGTVVGFYQPYYNNGKGGIFDGIGAHMDWEEIVAWKCLEEIHVKVFSEADTEKKE